MDATAELFFPTYDGSPLILICASFGAMAVGIVFAFLSISADGLSRWLRVVGIGLSVALLLGGAALFFEGNRQSNEQDEVYTAIRENRESFIEDRGVRIPTSRWSDLEFPTYLPQEDQRYGIAQGEHQGKIVSVVLAWEDGELKLYSTDGEELKPIER